MPLEDFGLSLRHSDRHVRNSFDYETRCVSALYERCFPGLKLKGAFKILVECVDSVERTKPANLLGVLVIEQEFDFSAYLTGTPDTRKEMALDALHHGCLTVSRHLDLPRRPFDVARECALEKRLRNEWEWPKKPRWSPDRKYAGALRCLHDTDRFAATLVIRDAEGKTIREEEAFEVKPSDFHFIPKMGKLLWSAKNIIVLVDHTGAVVTSLVV